MKKVSVFFSKRVQELLETDQQFKQMPLLHYALGLINYVVETGATGINNPFPLPVFTVGENNLLKDGNKLVGLLVPAYQKAGRIEVFVRTGTIDVCLVTEISFFPKGKSENPFLMLEAGMEPSAVRTFKVVTELTTQDPEAAADPSANLDEYWDTIFSLDCSDLYKEVLRKLRRSNNQPIAGWELTNGVYARIQAVNQVLLNAGIMFSIRPVEPRRKGRNSWIDLGYKLFPRK
jgi:hypothetical protein